MHYFSYGSNMSLRRLRARIPGARHFGVAHLEQHRLAFHKRSLRDGSAKCDAAWTGDPGDRVIGVLYRISDRERQRLDRFEGVGNGYEVARVRVVTAAGVLLEAVTYRATLVDPTLKPFHWYKEHVLRGALENRLPPVYIERLRGVESIADPDPARHRLEMAIYQGANT
ncbi:MAG TPA: gamma-glutamylcyclotransferase [Sedimenticola sp.]|nr:gamma-glutamylcyclotransferase [Sedimenticola sp.]